MISSDIDMTYLHLPLIYIKDKCTDVIRLVFALIEREGEGEDDD